MKAAIYTRVSTEDQLEGYSILAQVKLITEYCEKNNISINKIYTDEGISGQKENRPQFQQMIKDAENRKFDVILVHKFDRFARGVELSQKIKNRLKKAKINVISITEPIEDSPIGFFQEGLLELLAEYYVRNLSKEVKKGMLGRASSGLALGAMPYGYDNERNIIPEQADIIRKIYELHLDGYGTTKISKWLNDNRIPTYKKAHRWCYRIIQNILRQEKYAGYFIYDGKEYPGKWEPIIQREIFEKSNSVRKDRFDSIPNYNTKNSDIFPLLGLLKCGKCGRNMTIFHSTTGKRTDSRYVYMCGMARRDKTICNHNKNYKAKPFEEYILGLLKGTLDKTPPSESIKERVNLKDIVEARQDKIYKELERAKAAYMAEVFTLTEYKEIKNKLDQELLHSPAKEDKKEEFKIKLISVLDQYESETNVNKKRMILKEIIQEIRVSPDSVDFIFVL